ncbi:zinc ABC transporter substrate-binding protein [candidate division KSB1 bacterium]|nr:zinc ABC transporter substrate-binding protein [candidate division KSB1 bacterium]
MKYIFLASMFVMNLSTAAVAQVTVAAALPDLGSIAAYIGGDRVECFSIAKAAHDPHSVEVLPTYMVKVSRADLYLKVGLGLDPWSSQIIDGSRNAKLKVVDCSDGVPVLERPTVAVNASMGDVHPSGNPHYWLDPANGIRIARTVERALAAVDPDGATVYAANLEKFAAEAQSRIEKWNAAAADIPNRTVVTYHSSWAYFAAAFGFEIAAKVEPVPGIPPTASHLKELVDMIQAKQIKRLLQEPYFSDDGSNYLNRQTGIRVVKLSPSCADVSPESYLQHFDQIFEAMR